MSQGSNHAGAQLLAAAAPFCPSHQQYMARAIALAKRGLFTTDPNPRVGCVIVRDGELVAQGYHQRAGLAHAERAALSHATGSVVAATAYVTLEPCSHFGRTSPCCDALIEAGVARVFVGGLDPNPQVAGAGIERMRAAGIEVQVGLLQEECEALNPGYFYRRRHGRPYVRVKLAASLDGRTALHTGFSKWITGAQARRDVQLLRARAGAILTGVGTVLADDPRMTVRLTACEYDAPLPIRQPLLAIVDTNMRTPTSATLFEREAPVVLYTHSVNQTKHYPANCEVVQASATEPAAESLCLLQVLQDLAVREVNEVHVEAGADLCGALLSQQLVDELVLYVAPNVLGSDARQLFSLHGIDNMRDRPELYFTDVRQIGADVRLTLSPRVQDR